jgi:hypothetical protein
VTITPPSLPDLAGPADLSSVILVGGAVEVGPTNLTFRRRVDYEEWAAVGPVLGAMHGASMWWIGDWILHGEHAYGETYAQALDATGLSESRLQTAVWVASVFADESCRRQQLSFEHHHTVAGLSEPERERLLDAAEEHGWSRSKLRQAVRIFKRELERGREPTTPADPRRLAHVGREYKRQLEEIRSVVEPLVGMANDPDLVRLHRRAKDDIRLIIEHCESSACRESSDRSEEPHTDGPAQGRLAIGPAAADEERGIASKCPRCGGNKPLAWEVCGDCRLKQ